MSDLTKKMFTDMEAGDADSLLKALEKLPDAAAEEPGTPEPAAQKKTTKFYRPDQARDESGRFEDEGGGKAAGEEVAPEEPAKGGARESPDFKPYKLEKQTPEERRQTSAALTSGGVTSRKGLDVGTARAEVVTLDNGQKGVWKEKENEPDGQRRNIDGDLYKREAAASDVAEVIGLDHLVPATVVRTIPLGRDVRIGSLQHFVEDADVAIKRDDIVSWFDGKEDLARAAGFDYLIGNTDRHAKNWMLGNKNHQLYLIDNGLSFPNKQKESFANWEIIREAKFRKLGVTKEIRGWADKMPEIKAALQKRGLSKIEIDGVARRAKRLAKMTNFSQITHFNDELFPR